MKKIVKWALRALIALVVISAILLAFNWERLKRLYKVNTLFDQEKIVANFSDMRSMFLWKSVTPKGNEEAGSEMVEKFSPLPQSYEFQGNSIALGARLLEYQTTSLLVMHDGVLVHENYGLDTKREDLRISWSMAKSFLSAMFGVAIEEGKISSINDPVTKYVPELKKSAYNNIKIRDVLNMASGVKFNEDYLDYNSDIKRMGRVLAMGGSMDEFATSISERERKPGIARQYTSIDTHVLAMVLRAATGKTLPQYLGQKIWSKIGSGNELYYLTDGYGVSFALGGLNLRSRDYLRFGKLFVNKGQWGAQQIVPQKWVAQSTRVSAPHSSVEEDTMQYGYQWWIPPKADDEFFAVGVYGQYIYINPKAKIVIVKTAAHRGFRDDGQSGRKIKHESIAMFRAISQHYSDWKYPEIK